VCDGFIVCYVMGGGVSGDIMVLGCGGVCLSVRCYVHCVVRWCWSDCVGVCL
jgi:hypothetical protein